MEALEDIVARIARRDPARAEATLQADIRQFILTAGLNLVEEQVLDVAMESQVGDGTRNRIDIETGSTVIEVKKDLTVGRVFPDAIEQLGSYVQRRCDQTGARFLGVLTDGHDWHLFVPDPDGEGVIEAGSLTVSGRSDAEKLRYWLASIMATREHLHPSGPVITREMGVDSPAYQADHATLRALYERGMKDPEIALKHELWAKLLRTAFGSGFADDATLFIDHTLLVLTAEIIAHAAVGFDIGPYGADHLTPDDLATGARFREAGIHGVVESDFFDWPIEVDGGRELVRSLATRLSRFDWSAPEHDVLKHLYEAIITPESRQAMGEYYTPDWLAEAMVEESVPDPLETRTLDPSCGSGTFLFHLVRRYLDAAKDAGLSNSEALTGVTQHVYGMDLHPVAVTLARVTYLLAIGTERLAQDRGELRIPVFLGDSLQWEERGDLLTSDDDVIIATAGSDLAQGQETLGFHEMPLFGDNLVFPRSIVADAERFDALVTALADGALEISGKMNKKDTEKFLNRVFRSFTIVDDREKGILTATFHTMRDLQRRGRDHIWGYYVRNLIRPLWLSQASNRVDLLIGNPPWLRYNKMTPAMQTRYKVMAQAKGLLSGPKGASSRDLSTLFVVRVLERYGKPRARFSFVMPHGTMTRYPHAGFRSGAWGMEQRAAFSTSWDLEKMARATGFPMQACVIHGASSGTAGKMKQAVEQWSASRVGPATPWSTVRAHLIRQARRISVQGDNSSEISPYEKRFRNGAIIYPRMLVFVDKQTAGPLGLGSGRVRVRSRRSSTEKQPWKSLPALEGTVESDFLHPVHLGETLLPFRMMEPLTAVLPLSVADPGSMASEEEIATYRDMARWWNQVESVWAENRVRTEKSPLRIRLDYSGKLSSQLPLNTTLRVLYSKAGNTLTAALLTDSKPIIDHKLYWAPAHSLDEARYLTGILNSAVLLERVRPLQAVGLFGPRDFDKHVFKVPFGAYDARNPDHRALVAVVEEAEKCAATVDISGTASFQKARKLIRQALTDTGIADSLEEAAAAILPAVDL